MRLREVAREALRDVASGAGWALPWAVVLGTLLASVVGVRVAATAGDVRAAASYVASGAATTVQSAVGRIDGRACDALAGSDGFRAAGALRRLDVGIVPAAMPGTELPTYEVTAGMLDVLGVTGSTRTAGVTLSPSASGTLGLGAGDDLPVRHGDRAEVAGTYGWPADGRDPDLEYAVLVPGVDDGRPFDACWVTAWPQREDTVSTLRRTLLPSTGADDEDRPTVGQLNPRLGQRFAPADPLPAVVSTGVTFAAGASVGVAAVVRRRLALASDRHVGVGRSAQVVGIALQHLVWGSVAAAVALACAVVGVRGLAVDDAVPIVVMAAVAGGGGLSGAVVGGALAAACLRERALYGYFRAR